ncbi:unnamed protein product [Thelazia callipaeda]|uniref:Carboxylic ester hydrolase n=1 Tax=Thelazia callipaeda TaxID=103827 RepID=A0A0N5D0B3_THECL|nr:unnamed protein product [Thelazia callipaeda]
MVKFCRYRKNIAKDRKPRQIHTKNGIVEGKPRILCEKGAIDVFLGIPYAKAPTGERRFKKPEPPESWTGVMKCKRYKNRAPQNDYIWDRLDLRVSKSEDCLYLNVISPGWTPPSEFKNGFPVMFFIHGGGYVIDSAVRYHYSKIAKLLVSKDLIAVTIQYRLGFLGFFTTGDSTCPGNFGIWDQIMALKWVKENIKCFGGDPDQITIIGQSAGAASADLLSLSPYSRDLFKRVVLLSGNAECPWAVAKSKRVVSYCRQRAQKLGWKGSDNKEMIKFLRKLPASKLADNLIGNKELFATGLLPLTPIVDGDLIPCSIKELRKLAPTKPSIVGVTENEGLLFVALNRMPCDQNDIEKAIQAVNKYVKESEINIRQVISDIYFPHANCDENSRQNTQRAFINMLDDFTCNYGTKWYVDKAVERGETVYMFSLEYCNPACYGFLNLYLPYKKATHGVELIYFLEANIFISRFVRTEMDKRITRFFTHAISDFIKYGSYRNPNISNDLTGGNMSMWESTKLEARDQHLRIGQTIEMRKEFKDGRIRKLQNIFSNLKRK